MLLKFNGKTIPNPSGFTISKNKIWSENTRRNDLGDMVGTIIAIKRKVEITWNYLTSEQIALIDSVVSDISKPFTTVEYTDDTKYPVSTTTINAYFGDGVYPIHDRINGVAKFTGIKVSGIEK